MIEIIPETPSQHAAAIETLYDRTFGPGHFAKTAERLREGNASLPDITRVAVSGGDEVIGVCRMWPIFIGTDKIPALFVGPVAVDPGFQGQRLGLTVTGEALEAATQAGWGAAVIIGAPSYFGELGFKIVAPDRFQFPGPQDMTRVMVRALAGDAEDLHGALRAV
ncbi:MAG: N-acetyltransferase [Pseudomonadota bacterium]